MFLDMFGYYCEIYQLPKDRYLPIAAVIEKNPQKKIESYHIHGYVFFGFQQLCYNTISLEDFFCIGDITSPRNIFVYQEQHKPNLYSLKTIFERLKKKEISNTILIIDQISRDWFVNNMHKYEIKLRSLAKQQNVEILYG